MIKVKLKYLSIGMIVALTSCSSSDKSTNSLQKPDLSVNSLNKTFKPGDNFYAYANTKWMKDNPIPDDKSRYGNFDVLDEQNKEKLKTIFEEVKNNSQQGSVGHKIADFYKSGMDTSAIEKEGLVSLQPFFDKINSIESSDDVMTVVGYLHSYQIAPLFMIYSNPDSKNSNMTIAGIYQSGLGLPDRDYYLSNDDESKTVQEAYKLYLSKLFTFTGYNEDLATKASSDVYGLEYKLADIFYSRVKNRNPLLTYNKYTKDELLESFAQINWTNYFAALQINIPEEIDVNQVEYLNSLASLIHNTDVKVWKAYLQAFTINSLASYLNADIANANFDLYGKTIMGQKEMQPRWKRVQGTVNGALGEAIGQLFVEKYFPPRAKTRMVNLVENLRQSFAQRIDNLDWMSDKTKEAAKDKLKAITVKIGYPDKWRDYSNLNVSPNSYVSNILASNHFDFEYNMNKIGKPVDKEEWHMFPQTVNAYYNPSANEIVFPAAILQPPFFYMDGDDAVNYGAIGVVIGHEMTHGFDDQGSKFDKFGNLESWWTPEDSTRFATKTNILVDQFNEFVVVDTLHANGKLTLGENIADLGGLNISWTAYQNTIEGKDVEPIDGLTDKERFFLSYSGIWAQNIRDKEIVRRTKVDPHSLGKYRVNGPLPNLAQFYETFNIKEGDSLYIKPEDRAVIW